VGTLDLHGRVRNWTGKLPLKSVSREKVEVKVAEAEEVRFGRLYED